MERAARAGVDVSYPPPDGPAGEAEIGTRLFALAAEATRAGIDPELALRAAALRFADAVRAAEAG